MRLADSLSLEIKELLEQDREEEERLLLSESKKDLNKHIDK